MRSAERTVWRTAAVAAWVAVTLLVQCRTAPVDVRSEMAASDPPADKKRMIIFDLSQWKGDYWSKDVAHGLESSPCTSALCVVSADGSAPPGD